MPDKKLFEELFNNGYAQLIKQSLKNNKFESIKHIEIFTRKVKSKWFFKKKETIVKVQVDEPLYIMEILADELKINDYVKRFFPYDYKLEIEYS